MKIKIALVLGLLMSSTFAHAASVTFSPSGAIVGAGDSFSIDIMGNFLPGETLDGGGLNVFYDAGVVNVTGVTVNTELFDFYSDPGTIDNNVGSVSDIVFNTFESASGDFLIATLNLIAIGEGNTALTLSESVLNPFSGSDGLEVDLTASASITAVPVPAAAWLLASGLGLLGCAGKRRQV